MTYPGESRDMSSNAATDRGPMQPIKVLLRLEDTRGPKLVPTTHFSS